MSPFLKPQGEEIARWGEISKLLGKNSLFIDRTGVIASPFRTSICEACRLPEVIRAFNKSYAEICDERVQELLRLQERTGVPIGLLYSGGIDSTAVLVSFLKAQPISQLRDRITLYMNVNSINENPTFYRRFIRGQLKIESSEKSLSLFDGRHLIVGAEFNDQIFGNYLLQIAMLLYGSAILKRRYDKALAREIFLGVGMSEGGAAMWAEQIDAGLKKQSFVVIETALDFFWWLNFNFKWQATYFSMILRMARRDRKHVTPGFLSEHYQHFFIADDFQRWSMTNPNSKIRDTWESYKWPAKDLIFEFDRDADYRDFKIKAPSLNYLLTQRPMAQAITDQYQFLDGFLAEDFVR